MLGDALGTLKGKLTGRRVLPAEGSSPHVEVSFEIAGTLAGANVMVLGTYHSVVRSDGLLQGECPRQGVIMTADGAHGTWGGTGLGRFTGKGSATSFRGVVYFQSSAPSLARLTQVAALFEWDVDENGNAEARYFEWK